MKHVQVIPVSNGIAVKGTARLVVDFWLTIVKFPLKKIIILI